MRALRTFFANLTRSAPKREYARVHDITIKWDRASPTPEQENQDTETMSFNVFKQPLALHSTQPLTGFTRTGYCEVPASDAGNHAIAGIVSKEFLDFSASRGNDLRQIGLKDGCKWCLCVSRWKEAFDARTGQDDKKVPKVVLNATNEKALTRVKLEDLKGFAVDKE
ncbi:hypothetical protein CFE70_010370 [Pyrenophora teres f. teres 0-1]|uniref:Uncharacterized protein n=2 Tax=Pyrenophora teres f. teres TaxID=97479 RepID=E3RNP3_PYRTT|nr:hypothetical protein PTT_10198 [Pyrenophora teres f. teres 0-1]KAE8823357.1 hypothetical protein HRS9139_09766 [Pyrenophora teres f. teres]CAA9966937.1 hypothetical protein PTMSG1_10296 [Pyrenophora teres f. maculata]KAE8823571.1 hypothetical protein PTNB85_10073 [Pyrenophora teres f. teres]KAE8834044.1 hypothetical protein HRS9122_08124 [Pyrenophora teres f. teres]